jgi:phosphatidylglycerol:prolipoprotein diacylglycerol transferase
MTLAIAFPSIDPVLVSIGPISIRWYALAYVAGLMLGWQYLRLLAKRDIAALTIRQVDDLLVWCTLGVVLGGRIGYVVFYQPGYYISHPSEILVIWRGGMSFHGGLLGVLAALIIFARRTQVPFLRLTDGVAMAVPIGLFFGRIANFINGELYGRASDVSWAMAFPGGGPEPRHPSQLYEAALEGLLLFIILAGLSFGLKAWRLPGTLTGVFLIGYGCARIIVELFREPDSFLGFLVSGITMGQVLSLPMLALGITLVVMARKKRATP